MPPKIARPIAPADWCAQAAECLRENDLVVTEGVSDGPSGSSRLRVAQPPVRLRSQIVALDAYPSGKLAASGQQKARDAALEVLAGAGFVAGWVPEAAGGMRLRLPADLPDAPAEAPAADPPPKPRRQRRERGEESTLAGWAAIIAGEPPPDESPTCEKVAPDHAAVERAAKRAAATSAPTSAPAGAAPDLFELDGSPERQVEVVAALARAVRRAALEIGSADLAVWRGVSEGDRLDADRTSPDAPLERALTAALLRRVGGRLGPDGQLAVCPHCDGPRDESDCPEEHHACDLCGSTTCPGGREQDPSQCEDA